MVQVRHLYGGDQMTGKCVDLVGWWASIFWSINTNNLAGGKKMLGVFLRGAKGKSYKLLINKCLCIALGEWRKL